MKKTFCILLLASLLITASSFAGVPSVTQMEVTDVTPGSFAVTWVASEPSTASLSVYQSDCSTIVTGLATTVEKSDATGNMKATATGLAAGTAYCYQTLTTSVSTSDTTLAPAVPASFITATAVVRTQATGTAIIPLANDLVKVPSAPAAPDGVLEVLYLNGGKGPISVLMTSDARRQYFNLNNLFDGAAGTTANLTGGELVRISERRGASGCIIDRHRRVPADLESTGARDLLSSPRRQDIDYSGVVNILDVLRVAGGMGTAAGGPCFNDDLDVTNSGIVDQTDLNSVIGTFDATP
jgi:hypothetical protein